MALLLFFACPASAAERIQPRNVLILLAAEYGLPAYDPILHEIRTALSADIIGPLNLYAEYLDTVRFSSAHHQQALVDFCRGKYGTQKIDLLIAIGPNLAPIFGTLSDRLFSDVPTVIIELAKKGANFPIVFQKANITGVFPVVDMQKAIGTALALLPDTEYLFIVSGESSLGRALLLQAKNEGRQFKDTIVVRDLSSMPMEEILSAVSDIPDRSVVLFTTLQKDAAGVSFYTREAIRMVAAHSQAPVFFLFDTNAGVGALGGYVISFEQVGIEATKIALRILNGETPESIPPVREGLHRYQFDWRQLKRWRIPEGHLPAGSILLNRDITFYEKYFWESLGLMLFIALQSTLVAYLMILNRRQKALSMQLRESEGRYRKFLRIERSTRLGEMAASLAHELNQPLSAILSSAQAALRFLKSDQIEPDLLQEILQHIVEDDKRAASIISGLRTLLKKGRTEKEPVAINAVLAEVITIFQGEATARRVRIVPDLEDALPPVLANKNQLLQVLLNLMINAVQAMMPNRHQDRKLLLRTRAAAPFVEVTVRDFGPGIDPDQRDRLFDPNFTTKSHGMGMGLVVCRTIVEEHNGRIRVENHPDGGAIFTIELPMVPNE